jgi:hypothetical protein
MNCSYCDRVAKVQCIRCKFDICTDWECSRQSSWDEEIWYCDSCKFIG